MRFLEKDLCNAYYGESDPYPRNNPPNTKAPAIGIITHLTAHAGVFIASLKNHAKAWINITKGFICNTSLYPVADYQYPVNTSQYQGPESSY